ncbi:MAG: tyrosine-type recombinase/integrase, partial [Gemmatimonadaceae bacterium]|nr:tyrosine-type recombinase/integrase [Gemmatimonadaceae bacterium]
SVAEYLAWKRLSGAAESSLVTCESYLARLAVSTDADVETITAEDLMLVLELIPPRSRRSASVHMNGLLKWAILSGKRTTPNPMGMIPKIQKTPPRVHDIFSGPELAAIVDAARTSPILPLVNEVRALLLTETGMRAGGALHLRVRDVNLYERRVLLREKGDKERLVPIRGEVIQAFDRYLLESYPLLGREPLPDDYLWFPVTANGTGLTGLDPTRPVSYSTFWLWWKKTLERADVRYRKPHMSRHTYATNILDATGGNLYGAQMLLGHASPATTELYLHSSSLHKDLAVDALAAFRNLQRD